MPRKLQGISSRLARWFEHRPLNTGQLAFADSPLQLRNCVHFLKQEDPALKSSIFILRLTGHERWDQQSIVSAEKLGIKHLIAIRKRKADGRSWTALESKFCERKTWKIIGAPLGRASAGRLKATLLAWNFARMANASNHWKFSQLVTGSPGQPTPLLSLFLQSPKRVVVVDDGMATLAFAEKRRRGNNRKLQPRWFCLFTAPALWNEPLTIHTMFHDLTFGKDDRVEAAPAYIGQRTNLAVRKNSVWVLGNPFVEESGMCLEYYKAVLSRIRASVTAENCFLWYFPHRRENPTSTVKVLEGLGIIRKQIDIPFEDWVLDNGVLAEKVIAFGSTALEILSQFAPPHCALINVLLEAPLSKRGADSPTEIAARFSTNPRIQTVELDNL